MVVLALVLILFSGSSVYAENPDQLSGKALTEWIIENIQPSHFQGITPFDGDSGTLYRVFD